MRRFQKSRFVNILEFIIVLPNLALILPVYFNRIRSFQVLLYGVVSTFFTKKYANFLSSRFYGPNLIFSIRSYFPYSEAVQSNVFSVHVKQLSGLLESEKPPCAFQVAFRMSTYLL